MTRIIYNLAIRIRNLVVGFVPIVFAAVIAAVNTATDKSPKGYAFAVLVALATVFVSPAFQAAELKAKIVPPSVDEIVAARVEAALRAYEAAHSVAPSIVAVDAPVVQDIVEPPVAPQAGPAPTPRDPAAPFST